ncbi:MAG: sulfur carrier protein ThiS [Armatimonadetes bacterium]|nr:sulfur carrier protein ThiS [Armatimonadota bacterium]
MKIRLNGESVESQAPTVAQLLEERQISPVGIAVAVNESVVRRVHHATHTLNEGDRVEIIRAVQGG